MTNHLEDITTYYFLKPNDEGIHPISFTDAQIIECLIDFLTLIGAEKAVDIFERYKETNDQWILEDFQNLIQKAKDGEDVLLKDKNDLAELFKKLFTKKSIKIKDTYYRLDSIIKWEKKDLFLDNTIKYCIILNKNLEKGLYIDEVIKFNTIIKRDEIFDEIKNHLKKETNMKFIND